MRNLLLFGTAICVLFATPAAAQSSYTVGPEFLPYGAPYSYSPYGYRPGIRPVARYGAGYAYAPATTYGPAYGYVDGQTMFYPWPGNLPRYHGGPKTPW